MSVPLRFTFTGHSADKAMTNGEVAHNPSEQVESKQDGGGDMEPGEDPNEQEVIVIQDTGFTVKIQAPGTEPFDLQVPPVLSSVTGYEGPAYWLRGPILSL